jgi:hypothetical protein
LDFFCFFIHVVVAYTIFRFEKQFVRLMAWHNSRHQSSNYPIHLHK